MYPATKDLDLGVGPEASDEELQAIADFFTKSWVWRSPSDAVLLRGWIWTALLTGALTRRPHLIVTGKKGKGKTTLRDILAGLFGPAALAIDGNSTTAGIAQELRGSPCAVFGDEMEGETGTARVQQIIELARSSYSEGGKGMLRGSPSGAGYALNARATFCFTQTNPPSHLFTSADKSRWVTIEISDISQDVNRDHPFLHDTEHTLEMGRKFRRRVYGAEAWRRFNENLRAIRQFMHARGISDRATDTIGTLLAGAWTFDQQSVIDEAGWEKLAAVVKWDELREEQDSSDEQDCLSAILQAHIEFGIGTSSRKYSVAELIVAALQKAEDGAMAQLERYGLKPVKSHNGKWYLAVSVRNSNLSSLLRGTRWERGGWNTLLLRIEGAVSKTAKMSQVAQKATQIPMPLELLVEARVHLNGELCVEQNRGERAA